MPVYQTFRTDSGLIGIWEISESTEQLESAHNQQFSNEIPVEFSHERRKKEWLAVRLLLHALIGSAFSIEYNQTGKPHISHTSFRHISISHAQQFATVYLHASHPIGIDIESTGRQYLKIENKFLSDSELGDVRKHPLLHSIYWSCKEAIFKQAEQQGIDFRKQIAIQPFDPATDNCINATLYSADSLLMQNLKLRFLHFEDHILTYTI